MPTQFTCACMQTSWGTSCRRSRALIWSRVSMEGDKPPWRQKIWNGTGEMEWLSWMDVDTLNVRPDVPPVGRPVRWAAGSQTSLWSTSRRWRCRTSSDIHRRSHRLVWSAVTHGSPSGWWFAPENEPKQRPLCSGFPNNPYWPVGTGETPPLPHQLLIFTFSLNIGWLLNWYF